MFFYVDVRRYIKLFAKNEIELETQKKKKGNENIQS